MALESEKFAGMMQKILSCELPSSDVNIDDEKLKANRKRKRDSTNQDESAEFSESEKPTDETPNRLGKDLVRVKPNPLDDRELERNLVRIATKGVVKLFNAVKEHQVDGNNLSSEKSDKTRPKLNKRTTVTSKSTLPAVANGKDTFMKKLSSDVSSKSSDVVRKQWEVLRDEFLMDQSMKEWDKD